MPFKGMRHGDGVADGAVARLLRLWLQTALRRYAVWIRIVTSHNVRMGYEYSFPNLNRPKTIHTHNPHPLKQRLGCVWNHNKSNQTKVYILRARPWVWSDTNTENPVKFQIHRYSDIKQFRPIMITDTEAFFGDHYCLSTRYCRWLLYIWVSTLTLELRAHTYALWTVYMMTSSNGNLFRVTGHLCEEFTGPRWIPRTKASDAELWCFLWSASE